MQKKKKEREYYEQIYSYNFNKLDDINKYLKIHKLQIAAQKEIGNRKVALFLLKKSEFVIKTFSQRKFQAQIAAPIHSVIYLRKN